MKDTLTEPDWIDIYNSVYIFLIKRTNDITISQDITQDALLTLLSKENEIENPGGYAMQIAKLKLYEFYRSKKKSIAELQEFDKPSFSSKEFDLRLESLLKCARKHCSFEELEIIELSIFNDFSSQEVAQQTNLSAANVRQKLHRSLKKIRTQCRKFWM